jgi:hypothetical protein
MHDRLSLSDLIVLFLELVDKSQGRFSKVVSGAVRHDVLISRRWHLTLGTKSLQLALARRPGIWVSAPGTVSTGTGTWHLAPGARHLALALGIDGRKGTPRSQRECVTERVRILTL